MGLGPESRARGWEGDLWVLLGDTHSDGGVCVCTLLGPFLETGYRDRSLHHADNSFAALFFPRVMVLQLSPAPSGSQTPREGPF